MKSDQRMTAADWSARLAVVVQDLDRAIQNPRKCPEDLMALQLYVEWLKGKPTLAGGRA